MTATNYAPALKSESEIQIEDLQLSLSKASSKISTLEQALATEKNAHAVTKMKTDIQRTTYQDIYESVIEKLVREIK